MINVKKAGHCTGYNKNTICPDNINQGNDTLHSTPLHPTPLHFTLIEANFGKNLKLFIYMKQILYLI